MLKLACEKSKRNKGDISVSKYLSTTLVTKGNVVICLDKTVRNLQISKNCIVVSLKVSLTGCRIYSLVTVKKKESDTVLCKIKQEESGHGLGDFFLIYLLNTVFQV